jgi:hypothetical protein
MYDIETLGREKATSRACQLATLLLVISDCEISGHERITSSIWPVIFLAILPPLCWSRIKGGAQWITFTPTAAKRFAVAGARGCCALSCAAYLATIKGEAERIHVMSLTHLAQRLSDELANSLDISTFSDPETQEARP